MFEKIELFNRVILAAGIILLCSCGQGNQSSTPIVIISPQFKQVEGYTDKIRIEFYYQSKEDEKKYNCDFTWTNNQKFAGECPTIQSGEYKYTLNYIEIETNDVLASSSGEIEVDNNNSIEIEFELDLEIKKDGSEISNLQLFLSDNCKITASENDIQDAPIAIAGGNKNVTVNTKASLDGGNSIDPNCDELYFNWLLAESPENSSASLSDAQTQTPSFMPDVAGDYHVELVVNDGKTDSAKDVVIITASVVENIPPSADPGVDRQVTSSNEVILDASNSTDSDGDITEYSWTCTNCSVELNNPDTDLATFIAPVVNISTVYNFELLVMDNDGATAINNVEITINPINIAPVAIAKASRKNITLDITIDLDASASSDPNFDVLNYEWSVITSPSESIANVTDSIEIKPTFTPDIAGDYSIRLVVSDGDLSDFTDLNITVFSKTDVPEPEMVKIPSGKFQMGDETSWSRFDNELPLRTVLVKTFEMGIYEVTYSEYDQYLDAIGRAVLQDQASGEAADNGFGREKQPVINVSWNDIQAYIDWLNIQLGYALDDPKRYRLPTEAEWEYAARANSETTFSTIDDCIDTSQAVYRASVDDGFNYTKSDGTSVSCQASTITIEHSQPATVGSYEKNKFGLFDMHGNVWEWVADCYHENYDNAPIDSSEWKTDCSNQNRVLRGGSWVDERQLLRSAYRHSLPPEDSSASTGFRLARTIYVHNDKPIANAGNNISGQIGELIYLDGVNSIDFDGDELTYNWRLLDSPVSSAVLLSDAQTQTPSFRPDLVGEYQISLTVNDGTVDSTNDEVTITVLEAGSTSFPPIANAGLNRQVISGDSVILIGNESFDSDGSIESYLWVSDDSQIILGGDNSSEATFEAPLVATSTPYRFELTVTDNDGNIAKDNVIITVVPVIEELTAVAKSDRVSVAPGETFKLDATSSINPNQVDLEYKWEATRVPEVSMMLNWVDTNSATQFTPDVEGDYVLHLTVKDGLLSSEVTLDLSVLFVPGDPVVNNVGPNVFDKELEADIYVCNSNCYFYPSIQGATYSTIQAAINASVAGQNIMVLPGTYNENIEIRKDITVESWKGPWLTIIDASSISEVTAVYMEYGSLDGFKITGGTGHKYPLYSDYSRRGGGIYIEGSYNSQTPMAVTNNIITGNSSECILYASDRCISALGGGIFTSSNRELTIAHNIITNNSSRMGGGYLFCEIV